VALRPLPPKFRIIVDACQGNPAHPGMKDLEPIGGTIQQKLDINNLPNQTAIVRMHVARINHSFVPNASHLDVDINNLKVKVKSQFPL